MKIAVIGGGAAGCFCAAELKRRLPSAQVTVFEADPEPLAKVAVTGGGRCNFTNSFRDVANLREVYPRGAQLMKRALSRFSPSDAREWFASGGVPSVVQDDGCVFPRSQDAMDVVHLLENRMRAAGVTLRTRTRLKTVSRTGQGFVLEFVPGDTAPSLRSAGVPAAGRGPYDAVVVTTGGSPQMSGLSFLEPLGLEYEAPVPSLFTFNIADAGLRALMGLVVEDAALFIPGTPFRSSGPLLLTHWGMSGPAALKLSSYAARHLAELAYRTDVAVNWLGQATEQRCRAALDGLSRAAGAKLVSGAHLPGIPSRLWSHIVRRAGLRDGIRWAEVGKSGLNKLTGTILCDTYSMAGKSRWRDEFVTCGGVSLSNVNISTLESKRFPGLYFAGEVLDVDAVTGGFNLQAAWSMAYVVAESIALKNPNL